MGGEADQGRSLDALAAFALGATTDAVYTLDERNRFTFLNHAAEVLLRRSADDLIGEPVAEAFPDVPGSVFERFAVQAIRERRPTAFEAYYEPLDTWFEVRTFPDEHGLVVFFRNIEDRMALDAAQHEAAERARRDDLTGLPNRTRILHLLGDLLPKVDDLALLFLDLDGFKNVNDSLGHDVGDELLRDVAARLEEAAEPDGTVARIGGDEFVIVVRDGGATGAGDVASRIHAALVEPFDVAGMRLAVTASVGIARSSADHERPEDLIRDADTAMYEAKARGRNTSFEFVPELRRRAQERLALAGGLGRALSDGELFLQYQPYVDLRTGAVAGVEALVRWLHPDRGVLAPGEFIPVAEETGLIVPIGRHVLRMALAQRAAWAAAGVDVPVSVNLAAEHFAVHTLHADVFAALAEVGCDPDLLVLELTETSMARNFEDAVAQLWALRSEGVRIAIDDFGSEYSSLGRLATFPIDLIKFDGSLLRPAPDRRAQAILDGIVRAVTSVAGAMGVGTLAEGLETDAQVQAAIDLGCSQGQGYVFARPLPGADVPAFVAARRG